MSNELRKYKRIEITDDIVVKGMEGEHGAKGVDVSVNGICVILDKKLKPGSKFQMEFNFPDTPNKCLVVATVRWQRKEKNGLLTGFEFDKFHLTLKREFKHTGLKLKKILFLVGTLLLLIIIYFLIK